MYKHITHSIHNTACTYTPQLHTHTCIYLHTHIYTHYQHTSIHNLLRGYIVLDDVLCYYIHVINTIPIIHVKLFTIHIT